MRPCSARFRWMPWAIKSATEASASIVSPASSWRANRAITPYHPALYDEGIPSEGHHSFALCPFLVVDAGITQYVVGQVRLPLLGNETDLEAADRHASMESIGVGVHP